MATSSRPVLGFMIAAALTGGGASSRSTIYWHYMMGAKAIATTSFVVADREADMKCCFCILYSLQPQVEANIVLTENSIDA